MPTPYLITPIEIDATPYCCDPILRRTIAILSGDATETAANEWRVYESSGPISTGSIKFGICCAEEIQIRLTGQIETLNDDFDEIEIRLNDVQVYHFASTSTTTDPDDTISVGPFTETIALGPRPCGHIIEIRGGTIDAIANNNVSWDAEILHIGDSP